MSASWVTTLPATQHNQSEWVLPSQMCTTNQKELCRQFLSSRSLPKTRSSYCIYILDSTFICSNHIIFFKYAMATQISFFPNYNYSSCLMNVSLLFKQSLLSLAFFTISQHVEWSINGDECEPFFRLHDNTKEKTKDTPKWAGEQKIYHYGQLLFSVHCWKLWDTMELHRMVTTHSGKVELKKNQNS